MNIQRTFFKDHPATTICFFLMILGVLVRTTNYFLADISFWSDEAALALNIYHKNFLDFFKPLDHAQVAPIGFCLLEKTAIILFGNNEIAFRLIPFLAGTLAIGLLFLLVRKSIGLSPALLCAAQLAVIKEPIFYANDLKPYASDLAIAVGLMLIAWNEGSVHLPLRRFLAVALVGAVSVWFSFPAIFILGGIGALWLIDGFEKPDRKSLFVLLSVFTLWLASFWLHYQFLRTQTNHAYLLDFWRNQFMPLPPKNIDDLKFFLRLPNVFREPLWTSHPIISVVLFGGGCLLMWKQHRRFLILVLFPLFLNLIASGLNKYPFGNQLLQYATINLFIPISIFLIFLLSWSKNKKWPKIVIMLLIIANLAEPTVIVVKDLFLPRKMEQMKQITEQIAVHHAGNLPYYIFGSSYCTFSYYMERLGLNPRSITIGPDVHVLNAKEISSQLSRLKGYIWLIFGHAKQFGGVDYERLYLEEANTRGALVEKIEDVGAAAYLYFFP